MNAGSDPYAAESGLVDRLCAGEEPALLADLFAARAERWPYPAGYESRPFDDLFGYRRARRAVPAPVAYALIATAVGLVLAQAPGKQLESAFDLLGGLARASGTTELPPALEAQWEPLGRRASELAPGDLTWRYLCEWYRRG